jgi:hypothetical protein
VDKDNFAFAFFSDEVLWLLTSCVTLFTHMYLMSLWINIFCNKITVEVLTDRSELCNIKTVNHLLFINGLLESFSLVDGYDRDILIVMFLKVDPYKVNLILKTFYLLILNGRYRIFRFSQDFMIMIILLFCYFDTCLDKSNLTLGR